MPPLVVMCMHSFQPMQTTFPSLQPPCVLSVGWALAVVTSRAFRVRGPTQPAAMLPLIDMCNHSFQPNCSLKASDNGDVQLVSLQNIGPHQPLLLSYGNLSNDFLLMDYGFVVPGNPFDRVQLSFSLNLLEVRWQLCLATAMWLRFLPICSRASGRLPCSCMYFC